MKFVQEAPRGVAVHQNDGPAVARPLVDVVHSSVGRIEPARLERPQPSEGPVRRHDRRDSRGGTERSKVAAVRSETDTSAHIALMSSFLGITDETDCVSGSTSLAIMLTASLLYALGQLQNLVFEHYPDPAATNSFCSSTGSGLPAY